MQPTNTYYYYYYYYYYYCKIGPFYASQIISYNSEPVSLAIHYLLTYNLVLINFWLEKL